MTPPLTVCHCDPAWPAYSVCDPCAERARLHRTLVERGLVLDAGDADDRARDAADCWMAERQEAL